MTSFLRPLLSSADRRSRVVNARTGAAVVATLETAFDSASRNRGLLGRTHLPESTGLVLAPCNCVHTFFMRFPIDIVFLDRAGVVRRVATAVRPWRVRACFRAHAVLETAAGVIRKSGTAAGDRLVVSILPSNHAD